mgnify:CR=1 FL=1
MKQEDLITNLTEEEYNEIIERYGDLSNYIKEETYQYKKKKTKQMDKTKKTFFTALIAGVTYTEFKKKVQKNFEKENAQLNKDAEKGYLGVVKRVNNEDNTNTLKEDKKLIDERLYSLYKEFDKDKTSTKRADDKFVRVITDYYKRTKMTYDKEWVDKEEYLKGLVGRYDKQEKVIAYRNKDGSIRAYFDIASYDSMVYNTNLTNTGVQETIRDAIRRDWDIAYIDPHMNSCPLCQPYQGRFISLTGASLGQIYNGQLIRDTIESARRNGLLHPNCTHIPREAHEEDRVTDKWSGADAIKSYEIDQKIKGLNLKKSRLKTDIEIYEEIGNQEMIDKSKNKIKSINAKIRELKTSA